MENEKKGLLYVIIAVILIALLGWWFLASPEGEPSGGAADGSDRQAEPSKIAKDTPKVTNEQLLSEAELDEGQQSDIEQHKQEILARVRSSRPLSEDEKGAIGNIMLTRAHLYNFSDEERAAVFDALRR